MTGNLDELVRSVTLYNRIAAPFHLYLLPFLVAYPLWVYLWIGRWGFRQHYEAGFLGVAAIACLQILACLACYWSVHVRCFFTCKKEKDPLKATLVKVVPTENNGSSEVVPLRKVKLANDDTMIHFAFQQIKYVWNADRKRFRAVEFPIYKSVAEYRSWRGHRDDGGVAHAEIVYGTNAMDVAVPGFAELFTERATAPFFVFQIFCVALWCLDKYWYYSIFTLVMLVMFECTLVQQQLKNMAEIRKMGNKPYNVNVYRNRRWRTIPSSELVPGDVVSIGRSHKDNYVPCDAVLLRGTCIVDESMLTGESVPQMKEPIESRCADADAVLDPDADGKLHVLFGGTKVVQHTPPPKTASSDACGNLRAPDNGCVAHVLRTGFYTAQGKLLRTIVYGAKRVTANNRETFGFILFLLVFAVAAAAYVWREGCADPARNRYKLFLECTLILTSVVPPELPIELSLAVNTSLLALSKLAIFCTEPFRIPFAGKVGVCCFDKTGTLTSDSLVVEGVAFGGAEATPVERVPLETTRVLVTCHSLVQLDDELVGDPLEKATLTAAEWAVTKADCVVPRRGKSPGYKIFARHHFTAQLRRMAVVAGYNAPGGTEYFAAVKGAPEVVKEMLKEAPADYDRVYVEWSRRGARVLALAYKPLGGGLSAQQLREQSRDAIEADLAFVGFVVISCPLKAESRHAIAELQRASHRVVMITGDGALTACHVAEQLRIAARPILMFKRADRDLDRDGNVAAAAAFGYESADGNVALPASHDFDALVGNYDFCVTGDILDDLKTLPLWRAALPHVTVFARFAPKQKEFVVTELNALGHVTLMCGDGTNDVGALKHAHVGVAILPNAPERLPELTERRDQPKDEPKPRRPANVRNALEQRDRLQSRVNKLMRELEEEEQLHVVKLGDASIASPFTSKLSSIMCVCHIIKQGRCTLVTTLQMFKILALNALILAYTQSVLYLDGIKLRDMQATLQGILLASSFLFISRSKPLKTLSKQRPLPNIFNWYTISTVLLQFAVHFVALVYLVQMAKARTPVEEGVGTQPREELTEEEEYERFQPNIINSTVFVISMALQLATFAINYRGKPFMESLSENKLLLWSILISSMIVIVLTLGIMPELSAQFEIIQFPDDFKYVLLVVLIGDLVCAYLIDRLCRLVCGEGKSQVA